MIIDTLLKGIRRRYEELKKEMEEESLADILENGEDCVFEKKMEWLEDILISTDLQEEGNNLDYAAALILKEELSIENQH